MNYAETHASEQQRPHCVSLASAASQLAPPRRSASKNVHTYTHLAHRSVPSEPRVGDEDTWRVKRIECLRTSERFISEREKNFSLSCRVTSRDRSRADSRTLQARRREGCCRAICRTRDVNTRETLELVVGIGEQTFSRREFHARIMAASLIRSS